MRLRQLPSKVTREQLIALKAPALIAEDCTLPRYGKTTALGTLVLTVNTGFE